jgi:hypothetical protein
LTRENKNINKKTCRVLIGTKEEGGKEGEGAGKRRVEKRRSEK